MNLHVTSHAIERYQERVCNVDDDAARAALSSATIRKAAEIGAPFVKLGTGHRAVIVGDAVVTVLAKEHSASCLSMTKDANHRRVR